MSRTHVALEHLRRPGPLVVLSVAYLLLVSSLMIWRGISVSPDYLLLIVVPVAVLSGRFLGFLRDWVPFVALFLGYEAIRGIAPKAGFPRHYGFVIRLDKVMAAGVVPSQWLQAHLGSLRWLAVACTVVYFCHFVIPVGVGLVLWLTDRVQFLRFTVALLAMSFAGFVVFLVLPVAPPWLAAHHHLLPGVRSLIALPSAVSPYYQRLDPDVAAAFPSLHAAYPLLAALALWPVRRRAAAAAFTWTGAVWFSVVYLGQHYVTDVIGGAVFAAGTWLVMTTVVVPRVSALQRPPGGEPALRGPGAGCPDGAVTADERRRRPHADETERAGAMPR